MTCCRTVEEIRAAARADAQADPPLTQAEADLIAAVLAPVADSNGALSAFIAEHAEAS
jgi:hypothetical protein